MRWSVCTGGRTGRRPCYQQTSTSFMRGIESPWHLANTAPPYLQLLRLALELSHARRQRAPGGLQPQRLQTERRARTCWLAATAAVAARLQAEASSSRSRNASIHRD
jgi:hypothetical protein